MWKSPHFVAMDGEGKIFDPSPRYPGYYGHGFELREAEALPVAKNISIRKNMRSSTATGMRRETSSVKSRNSTAYEGPSRPCKAIWDSVSTMPSTSILSITEKPRPVSTTGFSSRSVSIRTTRRKPIRNFVMGVEPPRPWLARSRGPASRIISPGGVRYSTFA